GIAPEELVGVVSMIDLGRAVAIGPPESPVAGDLGAHFAPARRAMVAAACEKQFVRIGPATVCPVWRVVNLALIARFDAIRTGATAVAGVADESLVGCRNALLAAEIQRSAGVVVE